MTYTSCLPKSSPRYKPRCANRKMCVPLLEELKFLAVHGDVCHLKTALPEILTQVAESGGEAFDPHTYLSDVSSDPLHCHGHDSEWLDVIDTDDTLWLEA